MYGRRVGVGAQYGQIGTADWVNCTRKEMALLRAMEWTKKPSATGTSLFKYSPDITLLTSPSMMWVERHRKWLGGHQWLRVSFNGDGKEEVWKKVSLRNGPRKRHWVDVGWEGGKGPLGNCIAIPQCDVRFGSSSLLLNHIKHPYGCMQCMLVTTPLLLDCPYGQVAETTLYILPKNPLLDRGQLHQLHIRVICPPSWWKTLLTHHPCLDPSPF
jgi:hypothetical protein